MSVTIPKTIHLCWFSGDDYPILIARCIDSWKRHLPDYNIKIWSYDMALATDIPFVKEALTARKWAFAADVIRLYALYTEGGVYMDSDIFIRKKFDKFLNNSAVMFIEHYPKVYKEHGTGRVDSEGNKIGEGGVPGFGIQAAFFAAEAGNPFIKQILDSYSDRHFILEDGSYFDKVIAPELYISEAHKIGFKYRDIEQKLDSVTIYPSYYVAGNRRLVSSRSFAAHLCNHSWHDKSPFKRFRRSFKSVIGRIFQGKNQIPI